MSSARTFGVWVFLAIPLADKQSVHTNELKNADGVEEGVRGRSVTCGVRPESGGDRDTLTVSGV